MSLAYSPVQKVAQQRLKSFRPRPVEYSNWDEWLTNYFPIRYSFPFAEHHRQFWSHIETIKLGEKPSAYFLILSRGGGKDSNAEGAVVKMGSHNHRRFCLYVRATQDLANKTIQSIASMLESDKFSQDYPAMAERQLTKYGHSRGWKMDLLRCANGFSVMGLGLDVSVRGLRLDELRPDLIIFSDIDDRKDSLDAVEKKKDIITSDILPAGSNDVAVIGIQNLIHKDSIFKKIVDGDADFLRDRIVNGPYPAIQNLVPEQDENGRFKIMAGTPTWPKGQSLEVCQNQINDWGYTTFRIESQHEVQLVEGGMYRHIKYRHCNFSEVPELISIVCAIDPAVTDNDNSDSQAIQVDGLGIDDKIYRLFSFEQRESPQQVIERAILKIIELKGDTIVFETDQGGDLWEDSYNRTWEDMVQETLNARELKTLLQSPDGNEERIAFLELEEPRDLGVTWDTIQPDFVGDNAGSIGPKKHRGMIQLREYEAGRFVHVRGTSHILEAALGRFHKRKPFDLHDAGFWSSYYLIEDMPAAL